MLQAHVLRPAGSVKIEEDAGGFAPFLDFLYAERYLTFDQLAILGMCHPLLAAADRYGVPELQQRCEVELAKLKLTPQNFLRRMAWP